jgi:hypothetical protein
MLRNMFRAAAFILTLFFPITGVVASVLMYPMVLRNTPLQLCLILILFLSPLLPFVALFRAGDKRYFSVTIATFFAQVALESIINEWFRA